MAIIYSPHAQWGNVNTLRQTYNSSGYAGKSFFHSNPHQDSDFLLMGMNDDLSNDYIHQFHKSNRILLVMENPSIWSPSNETLNLAGTVISPFLTPSCQNLIQHHSAIPWFYGINFSKDRGLLHEPMEALFNLNHLIDMKIPDKPKLLSIIVSGKNSSPGYRWRLELASRIKDILGTACDIFGFGHNPISDKRHALDPYMFHLCVENESSDHYWSEKLADAYLGYCFPIYSGARRVNDYFPSLVETIEFGSDVDAAAKKAIKIITRFDNSQFRTIIENRTSILLQHNLYYLVDRLIHGRIVTPNRFSI